MVVVLVVAANLAHSAVGIREINNNPAGFSDGSDDHQVAITNSLKNNYPLYDIIMLLRGGILPDDDQRLTCKPNGRFCEFQSECCSGNCPQISPSANLAHSAVGIREINNNPAGFSDGSDDHQVSAITNSLKNNNPLYDTMLRGGRLPHDQRLTCAEPGKPCGAPSQCCSDNIYPTNSKADSKQHVQRSSTITNLVGPAKEKLSFLKYQPGSNLGDVDGVCGAHQSSGLGSTVVISIVKLYNSFLFLLFMRNAPLQRLPSFPSPLLHLRFPTTSTSNPSRSFAARRFSAQSVIITLDEFLDSLDRLLKKCGTLLRCTEIHARVIVTVGNCCSAFLAARIVSVYARLGCLSGARKVFGAAAPLRCASSVLLWNSILRASVSHGCYEDAVRLHVKMRKLGVLGDGFTYPLVLKACGYTGGSGLCGIVHGHVTEMGFGNHLHVGNELMGMYANLGRMGDAHKVFDRMGLRTIVSWNIMISGYASNCDCDGALGLFWRMESQGLVPNLVTWTSLLSSHARSGYHEEALELFGLMRMRGVGVNAEALAVVLSTCGELCALDGAMVIHGYVIKGGFEDYSFVKNALIGVYGKGGDVNGVWNLFLEIENKTIVSWNALIASLAESGLSDEAFEILDELLGSEGCGLSRPNVITWGAVIGVFASKGRGDASLELFRKMLFAKVRANAVTISTVLSVCAEFASLNRGREIHGYVIRASMDKNISVENGLVNMYTKCGSLKEGHLVFQAIEMKDLISWNSMIMGYGMHGLAGNAIKTFEQMVKSGYKPDAVTFTAVLSACSHGGLVSEGHRLFYQMEKEYKVEIQMEHYACMVDLLGRAGLLQEASEIMKNMAMEPNVCVWRALLNSCRMHKNTAIAEETASHIFNLNPEMVGSYMLLSNIYAGGDRWEDAARVRTSARRRGLNKNPGQSWIEVKKNVYMFIAGKNVQEGLDEVYRVLQELACQMEGEGCVDYISLSMIQPECGY
ncbi:hypothetical protein Tsubulata_026733 [Turnera subulata]|uniref:Pentatricopeptide repeat-containing protein n=1 Tax=Turnera subulata TaxID=218843 RepID=A0A9Q0GD90_9ROSI|nr:hypothetical protein Tsubulata_026733 [Turnera subulata]